MEFTRVREQEKTAVKPSGSGGGFAYRVQMTPEEEKEFNRMVRKPRSRKFTKAIKDMDVLSADDETLLERIRKENGVAPGEEFSVTEESLEEFRKRVEKSVAQIVEEEIKNNTANVEEIFSPCGISGCEIHQIAPQGYVLEHIKTEKYRKLSGKYQKIREILLAQEEWTYLEVVCNKLVHRNETGDCIKIYNMEEV